jgi:uncharacterized repeat protein (TIGR01451 family)
VRDSAIGAATLYSPDATIEVRALQSDLGVTGSDSPDPVGVGQVLTYSFVVDNLGPQPAGNVVTTDILPASVTLVSASSTQGTCTGTTTVSCSLGTLKPSVAAIVTIEVTPNQSGLLENTATVSTSSEDPNPANDSATVQTTVNP